MANKKIPETIAGVDLHPLTRGKEGRTHKLLATLEQRGVNGVSAESLSMIDRFRLLASAYLILEESTRTGSEIEFDDAAPSQVEVVDQITEG